MIVALHLEYHGQTVPDIHDPRILPRPLKHVATFGGKQLQVVPRAFVAAVFRPHNREHSEFRVVWLSSEDLDNLSIFIRRNAVTRDKLRSHLRLREG